MGFLCRYDNLTQIYTELNEIELVLFLDSCFLNKNYFDKIVIIEINK